GKQETTIARRERAFAAQGLWHVVVWQRFPLLTIFCAKQEKFAIDGITERKATRFREAGDRIEKKVLPLVHVLQTPGFAAVCCFVNARLFAFAAGHHVSRGRVEGHVSAKV